MVGTQGLEITVQRRGGGVLMVFRGRGQERAGGVVRPEDGQDITRRDLVGVPAVTRRQPNRYRPGASGLRGVTVTARSAIVTEEK